MKLSLTAIVLAVIIPTAAHADDASVACVDGRFGDHVEKGRAEGDAQAIVAAHKAVYSVDVANAGEPTQITLVWTIDGKEAQRQALDVGRSPHWRTWAWRPAGHAKSIEVRVLDAAGNELRKDAIALGG